MALPILYLVNPKTRMCQMLTGPSEGVEHLANVQKALKAGFVEVQGPDEMETFRSVTQAAKEKGWNPLRMRYDTWLRKQGAQ